MLMDASNYYLFVEIKTYVAFQAIIFLKEIPNLLKMLLLAVKADINR